MSHTETVDATWLKTYARKWLLTGVGALAIAGVFAVLLVVARAPQLKAMGLSQELFNMALVVHVDLSVLVWFLAAIALYLSLYLHHRAVRWPFAEGAAFWSFTAGAALMVLSPLDGEWEVIKSNYIPVLYNVVFFLGLSLLAAGMLIISLEVVCGAFVLTRLTLHEALAVALAWIVLIAIALFAVSGYLLPEGYDHAARFEYLFWAGGHTLQFAYTLIMVIAWRALFSGRYRSEPFSRAVWLVAIAASFVGVLYPIPMHWQFPIDSDEFLSAFTTAMIQFGGIAPAILLAVMLWRLASSPRTLFERDVRISALFSSIIVFAAGGVLGLMITGQNVTIPAHYHGSIVGVTLALMGYAYTLMPKFGYADVSHWKMAYWQPIIYAVGQLLHVGGLAYSGGYGVLRKTAVGNTEFAPEIKVALGVMGLGGLLAIIGGLLFVVVMVKSYRRVRA